jgi:hypothetical protein
MGYAFTDFFEVFYTSKVSWFGVNYIPNGSATVANGLSALGMTCYFKPEAPSFFVAGGLGVSTWSTPFESGAETLIGFGLFAGAGYEFSKHMNVEMDLMLGQPNKAKNGIETKYDALSVKLTVNALGY